MGWSFGLSETVGELTGEKTISSELECTNTTQELSLTVAGQALTLNLTGLTSIKPKLFKCDLSF